MIVTQEIDKTEFKTGEKFSVTPHLVNVGNNVASIIHGDPLFEIKVLDGNGNISFIWPDAIVDVGITETLEPGMSTSGREISRNGAFPEIALDKLGNYTVYSIANINSEGMPAHTESIWSQPLKISILPENYTSQVNSSNSILPIPSSILHSPVPTLTPSENQSVVNVALSIPELQNWSHDWKYVDIGFLGNNKLRIAGGFEWQYAIVNLKAPSSSAPIPCDQDWQAEVTVDMTTMKVVSADYPTMESHNCDKETLGGGPGTSSVIVPVTESPLKQFKSGIAAKDVKCAPDFQLIIKTKNRSPACVKLDVAYVLIKRGWAASESAYPGGNAQFALDTNSTIIPAHLPRSSGVIIPYYESSRVINHSGFGGVYNETFPYRGTQNDYVLKPGSTGIITFKIDAMASEQKDQNYSIPIPKSLNLTNYAVFYHEITNLKDLSKYPGVTFDDGNYGNFRACFTRPASEGGCIGGQFGGTNPIEAFVTDHPGVDVLFEPPLEVMPLGMNATSQVVTMMITADSNAPRGTYLVQLSPIGLDSFLLTVGDQPYHE